MTPPPPFFVEVFKSMMADTKERKEIKHRILELLSDGADHVTSEMLAFGESGNVWTVLTDLEARHKILHDWEVDPETDLPLRRVWRSVS